MNGKNAKGKQLRNGYTTGSCSAAVSKAAVLMLLQKIVPSDIQILTPAGVELKIGIFDQTLDTDSACCSVVKDSGDDPDVTNGIKIFARASIMDEFTVVDSERVAIRTTIENYSIIVVAGLGIGMVTLPGLKIPVGEPAINPVPRKMIVDELRNAIRSIVDDRKLGSVEEHSNTLQDERIYVNILIELSIPDGAEVAKKTYNPRLGIVGGISILGTTGIVEPVSEVAWMDSLDVTLSVLSARGFKDLVFTFGNIGEEFVVKNFGINEEKILKTSNFIGFMLDSAMKHGIERILIAGHIGKVVKVSAGIFNTHSRVADARMEIIAAYAGVEGASREVVNQLIKANTTIEACRIIDENNLDGVYKHIVDNTEKRCREYVYKSIEIGVILFSHTDECIAFSENAKKMIEEIL